MSISFALFAKAPVLGQTKTRLQGSLGESGAVAAHCQLVEHALAQLSQLSQRQGVHIELWISEAHPMAQAWCERFAMPLQVQQGTDLGARMHHALQQQLSNGASFAFVMGCDCPTLGTGYLDWAAKQSDQADVIIAPAEDGGYGLIGLAQPQAHLFVDMPWGTDVVYTQTLERAKRAGLRVVIGAEIWDVDRPEDWTRFQSLVQLNPLL